MKRTGRTRLVAGMALFVAMAVLILSMSLVYVPVSAVTIRVPQDNQTIQAGINAAQNGATVFDLPPSAYFDAALDLGWSETNFSPTEATPTPTPSAASTPTEMRFAVIGDFGDNSNAEQLVATLVDGWDPDFVITTGDNNYPRGEASSIDTNIGKYYSRYIGNYQGVYGSGSKTNRFWPSLGNHDWEALTCDLQVCSGAYFDYFTLPGNERYYDKDLGLVHLFAVDSDQNEPDGRTSDSIQAAWLQNALAASTSCFKVVYFHHSPYSSGDHGSNTHTQWPFQTWGADVVMTGHDHSYERINANGFPYFVNGSGGASLRAFPNFGTFPAGVVSVVRYNQDHGAMRVTATQSGITYQFFNTAGVMIDELWVAKDCEVDPTPTPTFEYETHLPLVAREANLSETVMCVPSSATRWQSVDGRVLNQPRLPCR